MKCAYNVKNEHEGGLKRAKRQLLILNVQYCEIVQIVTQQQCTLIKFSLLMYCAAWPSSLILQLYALCI